MQQRLDGISALLHKEQRKLLWAAVKRALEAEVPEAEADTAHALIQKMISCAVSECPGTQDFAAMLLEMYLVAAQAGTRKAGGKGLSCKSARFPRIAPALHCLGLAGFSRAHRLTVTWSTAAHYEFVFLELPLTCREE